MKDWIRQLIACIASEEVGSVRIEEAISIKYQNRPKGVFKYRFNDRRSRQNLRHDLVWVCSPSSYNDPYDSSITVEPDTLMKPVIQGLEKDLISRKLGSKGNAEQIDRILNAGSPVLALQKLIMTEFDQVSRKDRKQFCERLEAQIGAWEEIFKKKLSVSHRDSLKVCSFSETQYSIIMWSHYADQHRGFCIEYETESLLPEHLFLRMLYPVVYSKKLFDGTKYYRAALENMQEFNILFPTLAALHKSPEWKYEKEWRLVIPANMIKAASPWHVPTPKRLYLGSRMTDRNKQQLLRICKKKGIEAHNMHLKAGSFSLKAELIQAVKRTSDHN
jgi:hypothetical protein